ncbi:MAG TPA: pyridoxal phosphate-dependent aminotransferase [Bryobacteraceae bacterium]|nr:pyridoxal phosphate-dependent aminotransferase [Bryobacteraceae bacterium]
MFSSRLKWDSAVNPLAALLAEKRRAGKSVLDLTESNPTHAGFEYPGDEILSALSDPGCLRYDPAPRGLHSAREAVAEYYARRGVAVDPSRILLTASTSEAYAYLFKLLANPGDEILVPRPSYPLFEFLAAMESVQLRQYPLRYDGAWRVDFEGLDHVTGPRARAIVVVNPNNPTGSFLKREECARLEEFAATRGIAILCDEVFSDFALAPDSTRVPTLAGGGNALTFSMSGLSKIAGLPQMKLGWIVAGGPKHEEALNGLEWIADTYLSVATPAQVALPRLLQAGEEVRAQILERTRANLEFLRLAIGSSSPCRALNLEGGWYVTLQVPRTRSEEEWALDLLANHDVLVQPGFFYDFDSEAFLVLSLLTPSQVFQQGMAQVLHLTEKT